MRNATHLKKKIFALSKRYHIPASVLLRSSLHAMETKNQEPLKILLSDYERYLASRFRNVVST